MRWNQRREEEEEEDEMVDETNNDMVDGSEIKSLSTTKKKKKKKMNEKIPSVVTPFNRQPVRISFSTPLVAQLEVCERDGRL